MWKENTTHSLMVTSDSNCTLSAFIKDCNSSDGFSEISEEFQYLGDDVWEVKLSLPLGEYNINVISVSALGNPVSALSGVRVVTAEQYDTTINQKDILARIDTANSWKGVG